MSTSRTSVTSGSSLRPRAPRLISGLSDTDEDVPQHSSSRSSAGQLSQPRYQSPTRSKQHITSNPAPRLKSNTTPSSPAKANGISSLWGTSWNAIQSAASDFLGEQEQGPTRRRSGHRSSKSASGNFHVRPNSGTWGPKESPSRYIAAGTQEERESMVRAQKRMMLLSGAAASYPDALGKHKRRTSDDGVSASAPPGAQEDRDALVYLHHVKPDDTLAGITIKYSCQANMLRRANRLWPNDAVQVRKILTLPVDACGVKGRLISENEADLIMDPERDESDMPTPKSNGMDPHHHRTESTASDLSQQAMSSSTASLADQEQPWTHDSWVMFPNATQPTEIARLPRRTLGYFPSARRKSLTYSDLETPNSSLDIARSSYTDLLGSSVGSAQSPSRQDAPQRPRRSRRPSSATNGYFPSYLAGPGGVGTMAKNVKSPGPAQDSLNRLFASRLPNVAPPPNQPSLFMPDLPLYEDDPSSGACSPYPHGTGSGLLTPTGQALNLEHMGAAVEGWIRKMASKAQKGLDGHPDGTLGMQGTAAPKGIGGPSGIGDLIEMADSFEIGHDDGEDDAERGRRALAVPVGEGSGASFSTGTARSRGKSGKAD